jgi:hypothetical protein
VGKKQGDFPSLQMIVEKGRLVPASQLDAELIDDYPNGTELSVDVQQKRSLKLLRKYWWVLGDLVENAPTPWHDKVEASDALKLASGICDVGKDADGKWYRRPGSIALAAMDEQRFRRYYDLSISVLARVTGVSPDELRDRYKHIPETELPSEPGLSQSTAPTGNGDISVAVPSPDVATLSSPPQGEEEAGGANLDPPQAPAPSADLRDECKAKMLQLAIELGRNPAVSEADADADLCRVGTVWEKKVGRLAGTVTDIVRRYNAKSIKLETAKRFLGGL